MYTNKINKSMETKKLSNHSSRNGNEVSYTVYKNEFHPLFIAFLKNDSNCANQCCIKYNFWRETLSESDTRLTLRTHEVNVPIIQDAMFKSASWLAEEIWEQ
jgi:hypothetical protein